MLKERLFLFDEYILYVCNDEIRDLVSFFKVIPLLVV